MVKSQYYILSSIMLIKCGLLLINNEESGYLYNSHIDLQPTLGLSVNNAFLNQ